MRWVVACVGSVLVGCGGGEANELVVEVQTSLRPGVDFAAARAEVGTRFFEREPRAGDDWPGGVRVAELEVAAGLHEVEVALIDMRGGAIETQRRSVEVRGRRVATFVFGFAADAGVDAGATMDAGPRDGGSADAGGEDSGARERDAGTSDAGWGGCRDYLVAPPARATCAQATLDCLRACGDMGGCPDCLESDPDCYGCLRASLVSCANEMGCQDEWNRYACCAETRCGAMASEACLLAMCSPEYDEWLGCSASARCPEDECRE